MRLRALLLSVLTVLGLAVVLAPAAPAWACSCAWSEAEQARHAELIVVGQVTEVTDTWVELSLESVEKGDAVRTEPLKLKVGRHESSCGYGFRTGSRYRVNARDGATGLCVGVAGLPPAPSPAPSSVPSLTAAAPVPVPAGGFPWWAAGGGVLLLAAGLVLWRRRAR